MSPVSTIKSDEKNNNKWFFICKSENFSIFLCKKIEIFRIEKYVKIKINIRLWVKTSVWSAYIYFFFTLLLVWTIGNYSCSHFKGLVGEWNDICERKRKQKHQTEIMHSGDVYIHIYTTQKKKKKKSYRFCCFPFILFFIYTDWLFCRFEFFIEWTIFSDVQSIFWMRIFCYAIRKDEMNA